jgi:hypothetical protein
MMEKRFQAQGIEKLASQSVEQILGHAEPKAEQLNFPVGTKYLFNDKEWFVIRAWKDTGTELRRVQSNFGEDETLTLHTIRKDADSEGFAFLELTPKEILINQARAVE